MKILPIKIQTQQKSQQISKPIQKPDAGLSNLMPQSAGLSGLSGCSTFEAHKTQIFKSSALSSSPLTYSSFYYPVSFTAKQKREFSTDKKALAEKSGDFVISRVCNDITCPACGKKMINKTKFNRIAKELAELEPEEYLECLGKYTQYMRPVEESVYNEIYKISQEPGASKDIRTLIVNLRDIKMPFLQSVQTRQIKKMKSLAKTLPADEKAVLTSKIQELQQQIKRNNTEAPFRRKIMIDEISKIQIRNPRKYAKLQNIAKGFPTSADMNSAWIVKYSGKNKYNENWNSYDIALRFLQSSVANTDHILAYDIERNHDDISNYIAMHNACNSRKGNKPFLQWLNEDKANRIKYMHEYFEDCTKLIKARIKKKKYRNYVAYATQTIFEASKGQVKLYENAYPLDDEIKEEEHEHSHSA